MIKSDDDITDLKYCIDKTSSDKDLSNKDTLWNTVENNEHYCTVGGKVGFFFYYCRPNEGERICKQNLNVHLVTKSFVLLFGVISIIERFSGPAPVHFYTFTAWGGRFISWYSITNVIHILFRRLLALYIWGEGGRYFLSLKANTCTVRMKYRFQMWIGIKLTRDNLYVPKSILL